MARVRNIAPEPRTIPALGLSVDVDEVFEVPNDFFAAHAWPEDLYEVIDDGDTATTQDEE
jgi:hypothetical protein